MKEIRDYSFFTAIYWIVRQPDGSGEDTIQGDDVINCVLTSKLL